MENMEKLYDTGDWVFVINQYKDNKGKWYILDTDKYQFTEYCIPIHKKHSDALDHVLNGGEVRSTNNCSTLDQEHFIKWYDESDEYEIIKDKPSLNGHYCLATKEHYDKLVEDGLITKYRSLEEHKIRMDGRYIHIYNGSLVLTWDADDQETPMHLHNKEWVFGSLEHEKTFKEIEYDIYSTKHRQVLKPVERITREDFENGFDTEITPNYVHLLFDYIEYLESNQKDNN